MTSGIALAGFGGTVVETPAAAAVRRIVAAWLAATQARAVRCVDEHLVRRGFSREEIAAIRGQRVPARSN